MKLNKKLLTNKALKTCLITILSAVFLILLLSYLSIISPAKAKADNIESLMADLHIAEQKYDQALSNQYAAEKKYNECQNTINEVNEKIPQLQAQIGNRAKEIYINRNDGNLLLILLGSSSLDDFFKNLDYINRINQKDAALIAECKGLRESAEAAEAGIKESIEASIASANEASYILANAWSAIKALEEQNIPVNPPGGGGDDPGGGGGWEPDPGGGGDYPVPCGDDIISRALSCMGHPYGWGCAGPDSFDCSGLVSYAYTGEFVHYWSTYSIIGGEDGWYQISAPFDGCVCCSEEHCGIYYGGQMIHAPDFGQLVQIGPIQSNMSYYTK